MSLVHEALERAKEVVVHLEAAVRELEPPIEDTPEASAAPTPPVSDGSGVQTSSDLV